MFAYNDSRRILMRGLVAGAQSLSDAGCELLYVDGSFVSGKPVPRDFDACWTPDGVDLRLLDPVLKDFSNGRAAQKAKFAGEFFPATQIVAESGGAFVEFFQTDRYTGKRKGIVSVSLHTDPMISRREP